MNETLLLFLAGAGGAAAIKLLDNLIQFILSRRAKKQDATCEEKTSLEKRVDDIAECMIVSMLDRIQYLCKCYLREGKISIEDRRRLHIMHQKYHKVGGNGDLDDLVEQVDELPLMP